MKFLRLAVFVLAAIHISGAPEAGGGVPDPEATLDYIHGAWDTLTRSMTECHSLVDIKVTADPILYLPAVMAAPAAVNELTAKCHVKVAWLPRPIVKLGDIDPKDLPDAGLLYLPEPYVVPGGRFNEMYGWDSFFILLGLEADHREALAKGMVDNFLFEIENYGGVLNANRTYYLTRSQPPFLTSMIRAVYEDQASFPETPAGREEAREWLAHAYTLAEKDYSTWIRPEHLAGATGLARYFDYGHGPVPEMADDSKYYSDVIRWILAHPHSGGDAFLVKGSEHPGAAEAARLKQASCDVNASVVCLRAWAGGYRLTRDYYEGDRAMRESGFDPSARFGPFSGDTRTLCAGVPEQPAVPLRAGPGAFCAAAGQAAGCAEVDAARAKARCRHSPLPVVAARRGLCRLGLHALRGRQRVRVYHFALPAVGRSGHARGGQASGGEAGTV